MSQLLSTRPGPWLASVKSLLFPPVCFICGHAMRLSAVDTVCAGCAAALEPSRFTAPGDVSPEDLDELSALYRYGRAARRLVHRIKLSADPRAGQWLRSELHKLPLEHAGRVDLIVPIPSHRRARPFEAGPAAASLWPDALSDRLRTPVAWALTRTRTVAKQTSLRRDLRLTASEDSLSVRASALRGVRSVLLTDDVLTTGATARACARLLKRHGVTRVAIAVIARG